MKKIALFLSVVVSSVFVLASDHIDGVRSLSRYEQVDLSDLYVFPTPGKSSSVTVILNLFPGATVKDNFFSGVSYLITLRGARLAPLFAQPAIETDENQELNILCQFDDSRSPNLSRCELMQNQEVLAQVEGPMNEVTNGDGLMLFTGPRADPFFMTKKHFDSVTQRKIGFPGVAEEVGIFNPTGGNLMEGLNVVSIALEINLNQIQGLNFKPTLIAVAAESFTSEYGYEETLDTIGRAELTNLSLHDFSGSNPLKESFNSQSVFQYSLLGQNPYSRETIEQRLFENISAYDLIDGQKDWSHLNELTNILADDFLLVDLDKSCSSNKDGFLSIERAYLKGVAHTDCGGRRLTDDIMRTLYALYIGGLEANLADFETGFGEPYASSDKALNKSFPYLAPPWEQQWLLKINLLPFGKKGQEGGG